MVAVAPALLTGWSAELKPRRRPVENSQMKRIRRGWALTKKSWALLNSHRELVRFPLYGGIATIVLGIVLLGPGAFALGEHVYGVGVPLVAIGVYVLSVIGIYFLSLIHI